MTVEIAAIPELNDISSPAGRRNLKAQLQALGTLGFGVSDRYMLNLPHSGGRSVLQASMLGGALHCYNLHPLNYLAESASTADAAPTTTLGRVALYASHVAQSNGLYRTHNEQILSVLPAELYEQLTSELSGNPEDGHKLTIAPAADIEPFEHAVFLIPNGSAQ